MLVSSLIMLISFIIPIILIFVALSTSLHSMKDREKTTPFECGFDPMSSARLPFSLRFFLLAVIFLVFDIEIVILMPLVLISHSSYIMMTSNMFITILFLGLLHEWKEGSLDWS